jgi:hypothetical protein
MHFILFFLLISRLKYLAMGNEREPLKLPWESEKCAHDRPDYEPKKIRLGAKYPDFQARACKQEI